MKGIFDCISVCLYIMASVRGIHPLLEKGEAAASAPLLRGYERSVSSDECVPNGDENKKNLFACQGYCNGGAMFS
ncbi:MAG: hypothetical protein C0390_08875 [Syntrophus sp. (in: bacteria)]|nr:hypothetical protein [Syntrophus sp. (in: bacteria)]